MSTSVYLTAVRVSEEEPRPEDLPAERFFVHASAQPDVWVETEIRSVPARGRRVTFALARSMSLGFEGISGTAERILSKQG